MRYAPSVLASFGALVALSAALKAQGGAARLPTVEVFSSFECVAPGVPDQGVDSITHHVLTTLLRIGDAHRAQVDREPRRVRFGYINRILSPTGLESDHGGFVSRYREEAAWDYSRGAVRRPGQDWSWQELAVLLWKPTERNAYDGVLVRIPHVTQLTSPAFVGRHCFRTRRVSDTASDELVLLAFTAPAASRYIELVGEMLVDVAGGEVREARLALSRFPDWGEAVESFDIRVAFSRRDSAASVVDSVLATQRYARSADYRGNILARVEGYRRLWP